MPHKEVLFTHRELFQGLGEQHVPKHRPAVLSHLSLLAGSAESRGWGSAAQPQHLSILCALNDLDQEDIEAGTQARGPKGFQGDYVETWERAGRDDQRVGTVGERTDTDRRLGTEWRTRLNGSEYIRVHMVFK